MVSFFAAKVANFIRPSYMVVEAWINLNRESQLSAQPSIVLRYLRTNYDY